MHRFEEVPATTTMAGKKGKKKGRPSLLDIQKRSIKQQQQEIQHQQQRNPNLKSPNVFFDSIDNRNSRSTTRNPNSLTNSLELDWVEGDDVDDDDDERKQKKHKPLVGLNSGAYGSDFNGDVDHFEADLKRQRIADGNRGSELMVITVKPMNKLIEKAYFFNGARVLKMTDSLQDSLVESGPTTPLPDKKLLVFILDRLQKKDTHGVFSEPVDPEELPDYHDIVANPMDFSTVREKLEQGSYSCLEHFENDVFLICSNAMQYNSSDTIYFRQARSIQELAKKDFENLRQDSDDGGDEPKAEPKVARRGRPPGKGLKKSLERSLFDRIGQEFSSDATLASAVDNTSWSNGYNLRKSTVSKVQTTDSPAWSSHGSYGGENHASFTELEKEFPASVVRAVLKYGKKHFQVDENKRDTYKHQVVSEPSVLTTFDGELEQLVAVGVGVEHGYARSLAQFAANLGPVAWKVASRKIRSVLPPEIRFGPGWVGENKTEECMTSSFLDKQNVSIKTDNVGSQNEDMGCPNSQAELSSLNNDVDEKKHLSSFPIHQKPVIHSNMNGFSDVYGFNNRPTEKFNSDCTAGPSRPRSCSSDTAACSSKQEEGLQFSPDLNVGLLAPVSPSTGIQVSSSQQPDLVLQL